MGRMCGHLCLLKIKIGTGIKKGVLSQNVLAAISFDDLKFSYVLAGWEGSAHDSKVLNDALSRGFCAPEGMA